VERSIVCRTGFKGQRGDWTEYALWLGQTHWLRLWGELVSNSIVVISEFLIYCAQQRGSNEESESGEAVEEEADMGGGKGDGGADVVLAETGAEVTNGSAALQDEIEEVVAATPPLR
jgi:hypothetical protein